MDKKNPTNPSKPIAPPAGLQAIINKCLKIYPDQPNPLQVTTVIKYWYVIADCCFLFVQISCSSVNFPRLFRLGGQDPLDYISMYRNDGNVELNIPPHWHYVTFGLSDLHGDGRVHVCEDMENPEQKSGMGFELTFRLIRRPVYNPTTKQQEDMPPIWPANLLQQLARYVFQTGNRLCAGDNIPWKKSLDNSASNIRHMLIAEDAQLNRIQTPFGWVDFCQIVGVTEEELNQATWWKGTGVLNLLRKDPQTGGEWLLTDMDRSQSVFELFPKTLNELKQNLEYDGSDLAGINAIFAFKEIPRVSQLQFYSISSKLIVIFSFLDESQS